MKKLKPNRILFIGQDFNLANEGLSMVTKRNYRLFLSLDYEIDSILIPPPSIFVKIGNILNRKSYGFTKDIENKVEEALKEPYEFVFFDRSIFGDAVRRFSEKGYKVICFFHNVETQLSKIRLRITKNPFYLLLYHNIKYNENLSAKYSSKIIAISDRDQSELQKKYNLSSVDLMPTSFLPIELDNLPKEESPKTNYCLFIGSNFFANYQGISWFVKEVAHKLTAEVWVVGSICNSLNNIEIPSNVKLLGYADDLTQLYKNASCIISPVFSGSGLKTKTIEAIRYGKYIFGTEEAFVGINKDCIDKCGILCETKEDFIQGINKFMKNPLVYNQGSIEVFNEYFSDDVAIVTLKKILELL